MKAPAGEPSAAYSGCGRSRTLTLRSRAKAEFAPGRGASSASLVKVSGVGRLLRMVRTGWSGSSGAAGAERALVAGRAQMFSAATRKNAVVFMVPTSRKLQCPRTAGNGRPFSTAWPRNAYMALAFIRSDCGGSLCRRSPSAAAVRAGCRDLRPRRRRRAAPGRG